MLIGVWKKNKDTKNIWRCRQSTTVVLLHQKNTKDIPSKFWREWVPVVSMVVRYQETLELTRKTRSSRVLIALCGSSITILCLLNIWSNIPKFYDHHGRTSKLDQVLNKLEELHAIMKDDASSVAADIVTVNNNIRKESLHVPEFQCLSIDPIGLLVDNLK